MNEQRYNIYIKSQDDTFNIMDVTETQLQKIVAAYKNGDNYVTISGQRYFLSRLLKIKVFTFDTKEVDLNKVKVGRTTEYHVTSPFGTYFTPKLLQMLGQDVTSQIIGDVGYGEESKDLELNKSVNSDFVNQSRVDELRAISNPKFDLKKLIKFCEELNSNFRNGNYLSVGMIGRSILNHVPPIFGKTTFNEVANNQGGQSFQKNMKHLNNSFRSLADGYLHSPIGKKETLPNATQVDFRQDLDKLLEEIVRKLA